MMNSEQLERAELNSALFDGENLPEIIELNAEDKSQLEDFALIGAALRNDLPKEVNLSIASSVMAQIEKENIVPEKVLDDQAEIQTSAFETIKFAFKKIGFGLTQAALAASVAAVTIIGYQVMNVDDSLSESTAATLGSISDVSLASYSSQKANPVTVADEKHSVKKENSAKLNDAEIKKQQQLEVERINNYIRGYIFDTAAN